MSPMLVVCWLVIAYLAFGEPIVGRKLYQGLVEGRRSRTAMYRFTMMWEWGLTLFVVLLFMAGGISLRLLGLYNPRGFTLPPGMFGGLIVGICGGLVVVVVSLMVQARTQRKSTSPPRTVGKFDALLPRTTTERWLFAGLAITAGICEEVLFRGLPVYALSHPNVGPVLMIFVTAVIFGIAHAYQGWLGILATGFMGALFTAIYLSTGALWIPMALHALIDLRALAIRTADATNP